MTITRIDENLRIRLQLESVTVVFGVDGFTRDKEWYYYDWPMTDLTVEYRYHVIFGEYGEPFRHNEIDRMRNALKRSLDGKPMREGIFRGYNPNIQLVFNPDTWAEELYSTQRFVQKDVGMYMRVNLSDDSSGTVIPTHNHLDLAFSRSNTEKLYLYLCVVTHVIPIEDDRIQQLIAEGVIYSQETY